jgi:hypothetical protein
MWIYEYRRFDRSEFLPFGPYHSREEAVEAMKDYADRFGAVVQGPRKIERVESLNLGVAIASVFL